MVDFFFKIWRIIEKILFSVMESIYQMMKKDYTEDTKKAIVQFVKFCLVGGSNAIVNYSVYAVSLLLFEKMRVFYKWDYQVSQLLGFIISTLWAYLLNSKFVFGNQSKYTISSLIRFYITYLFSGLFVNAILLWIWNRVGVSMFIAPLINLLFTTPINFFSSKLWAFNLGKEVAD